MLRRTKTNTGVVALIGKIGLLVSRPKKDRATIYIETASNLRAQSAIPDDIQGVNFIFQQIDE